MYVCSVFFCIFAHGRLQFVGHNMGSERLYRESLLTSQGRPFTQEGMLTMCVLRLVLVLRRVGSADSPRPQSCDLSAA